MRATVKSLFLGAGIAALCAGAAAAADLQDYMPIYQDVPELVPVEIGTGWYLRGDVSYDFETEYEADYRYDSDSAVYDYFDEGDELTIEDGANFSLGAGYRFTNFFRGDLTAHYWKHDLRGNDNPRLCFDTDYDPLSGVDCRSSEDSEVTAWELMANAYVDLGTFVGFTPYIGGGIGAARIEYDNLSYDFYCVDEADCLDLDLTAYEGSGDWRFAYALMAGVAYDLTRNLKLDVGYRYVNIDEGDMFEYDESRTALGAEGVMGTDEGFDRHTIQAGLRYSLW